MSDKETKEQITNDKEFLNWIYERMICVYGEKDLYDYMINFKSVIDRVDERPKAWNEAIDAAITKLEERVSEHVLHEGDYVSVRIAELRELKADLEQLKHKKP